MAKPAISVSAALRNAGHTRHQNSKPGYMVTGGSDKCVSVWHVNKYGVVQPAGHELQAYGLSLAAKGYRVYVVNGTFLDVQKEP